MRLVLPLVLAITLLPGSAGAQSDSWERIGLNQALRLYTPASGALLSSTAEGLHRSDDGGITWTQLLTPSAIVEPALVAVHPIEQNVIYASTEPGLIKTTDGGSTWTTVLEPDVKLRGLTISPIDTDVVYAMLADSNNPTSLRRFLVSRDGGMNWTEQERRGFDPSDSRSFCNWRMSMLAADPLQAGHVFRLRYCEAGTRTPNLDQSTDNGVTWTNKIVPIFAEYLAGGRAPSGDRRYVAGNREPRQGGSAALVSSDDGATWLPVLSFEGGANSGTLVEIGGMAVDSADPMRLWVGLNRSDTPGSPRTFTGEVDFSPDGGQGWAQIGSGSLPRVRDLALGIDRQNLFAATDNGVYRLHLNPSDAPTGS